MVYQSDREANKKVIYSQQELAPRDYTEGCSSLESYRKKAPPIINIGKYASYSSKMLDYEGKESPLYLTRMKSLTDFLGEDRYRGISLAA